MSSATTQACVGIFLAAVLAFTTYDEGKRRGKVSFTGWLNGSIAVILVLCGVFQLSTAP